ncbi:MAG: DUF1512 family protein [Candidatus Aenigmatarchaeota archaeon]
MIKMDLFNPNIDVWNIIYILLIFIVMPLLYLRLSYWQIIWKLEEVSRTIDSYLTNAEKIIVKKVSKNPSKELKESIKHFLEFFTIEPVKLDPYGIISKFEHIANLAEERYKYFVNQIAPNTDTETKANIMMGLSGAISLNFLSKLVKHYLGLVKKTKNFQLGLVFQLNIPFIERASKALLYGTEALTNGWPIGDAIGNLIGASLVEDGKLKEIEEGTLLGRRKMKGKEVYIIRAKGPGGRLGKLGKAVEKITKREKIAKIITIDAAVKLEGEETGSIAEGIGVAIGGIGVDKAYIENIAVKKKIPITTIIVKMSEEEAIQPMKKEILASKEKVLKLVEEEVARTKERGKIIIVGVGNSCGIGNNKKEVEESEKKIRKVIKIFEEREKKKPVWKI